MDPVPVYGGRGEHHQQQRHPDQQAPHLEQQQQHQHHRARGVPGGRHPAGPAAAEHPAGPGITPQHAGPGHVASPNRDDGAGADGARRMVGWGWSAGPRSTTGHHQPDRAWAPGPATGGQSVPSPVGIAAVAAGFDESPRRARSGAPPAAADGPTGAGTGAGAAFPPVVRRCCPGCPAGRPVRGCCPDGPEPAAAPPRVAVGLGRPGLPARVVPDAGTADAGPPDEPDPDDPPPHPRCWGGRRCPARHRPWPCWLCADRPAR